LLRWIILGILFIIALFKFKQDKKYLKISTPVYLLSCFYLIQFLIALIYGVDYIRFFLMTILCLFIPPVIGKAIEKDRQIIKYFIYSITFFIGLSVVLNGHLVFSRQRFFGFMNNANIYGISTVFWMVILLIADKYKLVNKSLFWLLFIGIFLTMIFSGSRNAFIGAFIVIMINYYKQFNKLALRIGLLFSVFFIASYFIDLSFLTDRYFDITNSISDSGRDVVWQRASYAIEQNLWFGNGMDANLRIANTGNMHNCYIRFVLNMGLFFTIHALTMYLLSISSVYTKKNVPLILVGYLVAFALMNVGEDFFVGLGSSAFVYLLFIYGFINYYISKPKRLLRNLNTINTQTKNNQITFMSNGTNNKGRFRKGIKIL